MIIYCYHCTKIVLDMIFWCLLWLIWWMGYHRSLTRALVLSTICHDMDAYKNSIEHRTEVQLRFFLYMWLWLGDNFLTYLFLWFIYTYSFKRKMSWRDLMLKDWHPLRELCIYTCMSYTCDNWQCDVCATFRSSKDFSNYIIYCGKDMPVHFITSCHYWSQ
jgi:hypothetical protein